MIARVIDTLAVAVVAIVVAIVVALQCNCNLMAGVCAPRRAGDGVTWVGDDHRVGAGKPFRPRVEGLSDEQQRRFWNCGLCTDGDRGERWECMGNAARELAATAAHDQEKWLTDHGCPPDARNDMPVAIE